jgi:hypothetical protein
MDIKSAHISINPMNDILWREWRYLGIHLREPHGKRIDEVFPFLFGNAIYRFYYVR